MSDLLTEKEAKEGWRNAPEQCNLAVGEVITGTYASKLEATNHDGKPNHVYIVTVDGRDVSLRGSSVLNALMRAVPVGSLVRIKYTNDVYNNESGRTTKHFEVAYRPPSR